MKGKGARKEVGKRELKEGGEWSWEVVEEEEVREEIE